MHTALSTWLLRFRPPRIALLLLAFAAVVHRMLGDTQFSIIPLPLAGISTALVVFGLMMRGWWQFRQQDVAVCPTADTSRLISGDIYRFTRNPMYLGITEMLLGIALSIGAWPYYLSALGFFLIINNVFCPCEEHKLSAAFGG